MGRVRPGDNDLLILSSPGRYLWVRLDLAGRRLQHAVGGEPATGVPAELLPALPPRRVLRRSGQRRLPGPLPGDRPDHPSRTSRPGWRACRPCSTRWRCPIGFVDYLAGWLNVPVEGTWTSQQKRLLIDATRGYFRTRGTPAAIRAHVAAYLRSMTGVTPAADGLPQLVEGFRQRQYRTLPSGADSQHPLWSLAVTARLQADRFDRLGQVRLVSVGDPAAGHVHRARLPVLGLRPGRARAASRRTARCCAARSAPSPPRTPRASWSWCGPRCAWEGSRIWASTPCSPRRRRCA